MLTSSHRPCSLVALCLLACRPATTATPHPRAEDQAHPAEALDAAAPETEGAPRPAQTIYRSELDRALRGGPAYLLRQLGPEPARQGGRFVGWELTRVFPDDPDLCAPGCDIEPGDVILLVAGDRLETPQALSRLIERLPQLETLEVQSTRNGTRRVVTYALVEDRPAR
jgi:type II secretory pathway component PulC